MLRWQKFRLRVAAGDWLTSVAGGAAEREEEKGEQGGMNGRRIHRDHSEICDLLDRWTEDDVQLHLLSHSTHSLLPLSVVLFPLKSSSVFFLIMMASRGDAEMITKEGRERDTRPSAFYA